MPRGDDADETRRRRTPQTEKLKQMWSPQQIAGRLNATYLSDAEMQVPYETIHHPLIRPRGLHPVPRREPQRADCPPAHQASNPTPVGDPLPYGRGCRIGIPNKSETTRRGK